MRSFARSFWKYLIDAFLFAIFPVLGTLSSESNTSFPGIQEFCSNYELLLYGCIAAIYFGYKVYFYRALTATIGDVEEVQGTVNLVLTLMLSEYYEEVEKLGSDQASIRINLMLKTKSWIPFRSYMKIYFYSGVPDELAYSYTEEEIEMKWFRGEGACGSAWKNCRPVLYGAEHKDYNQPKNTLKARHKTIADKSPSILSVPIWSKFQDGKHVFGILNLDSQDDISRTQFNNDRIIKIIRERTVLVSYVLSDFYAGVQKP